MDRYITNVVTNLNTKYFYKKEEDKNEKTNII